MNSISGFGPIFAFCLATGVGAEGFAIKGAELLDQNGQPFVMKGFAMPLAWYVNDVNSNLVAVKNKTGSNCFRIVMETGTADNAWQSAVNTCISNKVIPMVELHNVTGGTDAGKLNDMAKYWAGKKTYLTSSNVAKYVLINIANEWGDWNMANTTAGKAGWRDAYKTCITTIRSAGIKTTLVIDAPDWGQDLKNGATILAHAQELQEFDPEHNILFSIHMYCEWGSGGGSNPATALPALKAAGIPVIVGEFGYQHTSGSSTCDINEALIISSAEASGIGWLAWSWKGNGSPVQYLDLSSDWAGNNLSTWGNTVVNGPNGTKTAKTASIFDGVGITPREGRDFPARPASPRLTLGKTPAAAPDANGRWSLDRRTMKFRVLLE